MESQQEIHRKSRWKKLSLDDILKLMDSDSNIYSVFFYPGYISLYVYYFLKAKTLKDEKGTIAKSIVISFSGS